MAFKMKGWSGFKQITDDKKIQIVLNPGKKDSLNKESETNVVNEWIKRKDDNSECTPGQKCIDPWKELEDQIKNKIAKDKESSFKKIKVEPASMAPIASEAKAASTTPESMTYEKHQEWLAKNPPKPKDIIDPLDIIEDGPKDKKKPIDDDSEKINKLQKLKSRIKRNRYNKKAIEKKPLTDQQLQNINKRLGELEKGSEEYRQMKKLLKFNKKLHG